jgi:RHS repeat-associated protein
VKYDPWGNIEEEYNPNDIEQNIRLPGQYHDRETDLYYNRHRYYDPKIGAYINQDPVRLIGGFNFYSYVESKPIKYIDPNGLFKNFIKKTDPPPKGSANCSYAGKTFAAPPGTNFNDVFKAGQDTMNTAIKSSEFGGIDPITLFGAEAGEDIGKFGRFDYQRNATTDTFIAPYTDASNFAVGVYMAGAGFSYDEVESIGKLYAKITGSTGAISKKIEYWKAGWNAAQAGGLSCICK